MKKSILNIGKALNKSEQLTINGGSVDCSIAADCIACGGGTSPFAPGQCLGDTAVWICCNGGIRG